MANLSDESFLLFIGHHPMFGDRELSRGQTLSSTPFAELIAKQFLKNNTPQHCLIFSLLFDPARLACPPHPFLSQILQLCWRGTPAALTLGSPTSIGRFVKYGWRGTPVSFP
jgi:hypothetical protein